jgi:TetR/AcrR family transcriptional regulator, cholesterol catabolism regulator
MARSEAATSKSPPKPDDLPMNQRARRDGIIHAALALLEEREYEAIQIRDVAERAEVALATVYRYFASKEHVYAAALLEWSKTYDLRRGADKKELESDADRVRYLLVRAVRAFARRPQLLRAEMVLESSQDPHARALFDDFASRHISVLSGALRNSSPNDVDAIVEATNAVLSAKLRSWARGRCTIKDVELSVNRVVDLVLPAADSRSKR